MKRITPFLVAAFVLSAPLTQIAADSMFDLCEDWNTYRAANCTELEDATCSGFSTNNDLYGIDVRVDQKYSGCGGQNEGRFDVENTHTTVVWVKVEYYGENVGDNLFYYNDDKVVAAAPRACGGCGFDECGQCKGLTCPGDFTVCMDVPCCPDPNLDGCHQLGNCDNCGCEIGRTPDGEPVTLGPTENLDGPPRL